LVWHVVGLLGQDLFDSVEAVSLVEAFPDWWAAVVVHGVQHFPFSHFLTPASREKNKLDSKDYFEKNKTKPHHDKKERPLEDRRK